MVEQDNNSADSNYKIAAILDNHIVEILNTDSFMNNVLFNHKKVIDVTDVLSNGTYTAAELMHSQYNEETNTFRPKKPHNSWTWDEQIQGWAPPIAMPIDEKDYIWLEDRQMWSEIVRDTTPTAEDL